MRRIVLLLAVLLGVVAFGQAASAAGTSIIAGGSAGCIRMSVAGATNEAALKITFEDGRTVEYCIEFSEPEITGAQLLFRTGLPVVTALNGGLGAAVCSIDGEGCNDPGDCFCKCRGGTCAYWAYFQRKNGAWQYSPQGSGSRIVRNGDADAWVWGSGTSSPGAAVDCADPTATPTPTLPPPPTATVPPTRTSTPAPSEDEDAPIATNTRTTPTVAAAGPAPTQPPGAAAPPQSAATGTPASGVLGQEAGLTPGATASVPAGTPSPTRGTTTVVASPTKVQKPTGAIRISEAQGEQNAERQAEGGDWSWGSVGMFGVAVVAIGAVAGGVMWRRRGTG